MSPTDGRYTATEIRAGLLVLAALAALATFLVALSGWRPADRSAHHHSASFTNVAGLEVGADVRFGGLKAGRVTALRPDPDDRSRIRVELEVAGGTPVNTESLASIGQVSLTAEKHLEISTGSAGAPLLPDGAPLPSRATGGGLIELPEMEGVITRLERLLEGLDTLVGATAGEDGSPGETVNLQELFAALKATLDEGAGAARQLGAVLGDNREGFTEVVSRLGALEESAARLLAELQAVVAENREPLGRSLANIERLTAETSARMEELGAAAGSLGDLGANAADLMEDQRTTIEEILMNLRIVTRNLAELSRILADKPNALVTGSRSGEAPGGSQP